MWLYSIKLQYFVYSIQDITFNSPLQNDMLRASLGFCHNGVKTEQYGLSGSLNNYVTLIIQLPCYF